MYLFFLGVGRVTKKVCHTFSSFFSPHSTDGKKKKRLMLDTRASFSKRQEFVAASTILTLWLEITNVKHPIVRRDKTCCRDPKTRDSSATACTVRGPCSWFPCQIASNWMHPAQRNFGRGCTRWFVLQRCRTAGTRSLPPIKKKTQRYKYLPTYESCGDRKGKDHNNGLINAPRSQPLS